VREKEARRKNGSRRETLELHSPRWRRTATPPEPTTSGNVARLDDRCSASLSSAVPVRRRSAGVKLAVEKDVGIVAPRRTAVHPSSVTGGGRARRVHLRGGNVSGTTATATVPPVGSVARLGVVRPDGGVVDLVAGHLHRGGGGTGTDAEEETVGVVGEGGLEGAGDGAGVADEGSRGDEGRTVVAGRGLEAPDGSAVRKQDVSLCSRSTEDEKEGRKERKGKKRTRRRCPEQQDRERRRERWRRRGNRCTMRYGCERSQYRTRSGGRR
jgi:hypothetical protein